VKDTDLMCGHLLFLCWFYSREQEAVKEGWRLKKCFKLWRFSCCLKGPMGTLTALPSMSKKRERSTALHLPSHTHCFGVMCFVSVNSGQGDP